MGSTSRCWFSYGRYLAHVAHGDLGPSLRYRDARVTELIAGGLPLSLTIGLVAAALAFLVGVPLGAWAAWRSESPTARGIMGLLLLGVILPGFVTGPLLALVFGIYWPVFALAATNRVIRVSWCFP